MGEGEGGVQGAVSSGHRSRYFEQHIKKVAAKLFQLGMLSLRKSGLAACNLQGRGLVVTLNNSIAA